MEILSAGTSGASAEIFFGRLKLAGASSVVDVRLNRTSQLAGFSKERDLQYFISQLTDARYLVEPLLAPLGEDLKAYRAKQISWADYESRYLQLMDDRRVSQRISFNHWGTRPVLLCSEREADQCHRRLAAEYIVRELGTSLDIRGIRHIA